VYERSALYDQWRAADGAWIIGRLGLTDDALASGELPNASATLLPRLVLSRQRLRAVLPSFASGWIPNEGHGWSARRDAGRVYEGFTVLLNVEQSPHPENRVTLDTRRDSLGVPLPMLHWSWRADDHARLEWLRDLVGRELESVGAVTIDRDARPDPNAHHHAGTTRMHDDPRHGVADGTGREHGAENVYVAGASIFPTAGFANPVLTIVALSVRLARHLAATS
jgi:choline dehydrogenase-like flavoprotein